MTTTYTEYLFSNGKGLWWTLCVNCGASSPEHHGPDDLLILAKATKAGWVAERKRDGVHRLICPRCDRIRRHRGPKEPF
ncbi:MAG: hypothetical protein JWO38_4893 [Gemmataceae bacterium]|nr:hypothetical protein [Gemmataceae bacterium]